MSFFNKAVQIKVWQFDLLSIILVLFSFLLGLIVASQGLFTALAAGEATVIFDTDTQFSTGTLNNVQISGSDTNAKIKISSSDGNSFFREVQISNTDVNTLTDFQINFNINTQDLIANSKMRSDCGDLRVYDSTNTTELSYWIHDGTCNTANTKVWVKIPSLTGSATTNINIFYGDLIQTTLSNPSTTFEYFNDFSTSPTILRQTYTASSNLYWYAYMLIPEINMEGRAINFDATYSEIIPNSNSNGYRTGFRDNLSTVSLSYADLTGFGLVSSTGGALVTAVNAITTSSSYPVQINTDYYVRVGSASSTTNLKMFLEDSLSPVVSSNRANSITSYNARYFQFAGSHVAYPSEFPDANTYSADNYVQYDSVNQRVNIKATRKSLDGTLLYASNTGSLDNLFITKYTHSDYSVSVGNEQSLLPPEGTWESSPIDLVWNTSWGDGIDINSTALSVNVFASSSPNSQVQVDLKYAETSEGLSSANYINIGNIDEAGIHNYSASDLTVAGIPSGSSAARYIQIRIVLKAFDGTVNPEVDSINLFYTPDSTNPDVNASSILMQKTQGGDFVVEGDWISSLSPYFSWTAGNDNESGIAGYCLYLGADSLANPQISKGILGTGNINLSSNPCPFIVSTNNIDFATASFRGPTWLTTSNDLYYLNIKAVDFAGNIFNGPSVQFSFKFDNEKPVPPAFISLPGGYISTKDATFTWPVSGSNQAYDNHSGLYGLQYRIANSGTWYGELHNGQLTDILDYDGSYTTDATYDYPVLNEGENIIYIRAIDIAGNVSTNFTTGVLKINTAAPSAPQNLTVDPTNNTTNNYSFAWEAPSSFTGSEQNIVYCYTINTLPSEVTCNFTQPGSTNIAANAYATQPGVNTFYLVARDEASNINYEVYSSIQFTYSGSAPGIPLGVDVADISIKASEDWRLAVAWNEPENVGAGINSYKIYRFNQNLACSDSFDQFTNVGVTSGNSYIDTNLAQQRYYYCIVACDSANACSAPSTTVNAYPDGKYTTPPLLLSGPTVSSVSTRSFRVSWVTDRPADSRIAFGLTSNEYFESEISKSELTQNHDILINNLDPGTTYFYRVKWIDEDGNLGQSSEFTIQTSPAPIVSNVRSVRTGISSSIIQFTTLNATSVRVYYGPTTSFGGLQELPTSPQESDYSVLIDNLNDNTKYFYKINTVDSDGFEYEGTVLDFTTLPRPRVFNVQVEEVIGESQPTVKVTWQSNTNVSSIIRFSTDTDTSNVRDQVDIEPKTEHEMIVTGLSPSTTYILRTNGIDKIGNLAESDPVTFNTSIDSRPPKVTDIKVEGAISNSSQANLGSDPKAQLVVSWNTDELATAQVLYSEGKVSDFSQSSYIDSNLTYNHTSVISDLKPSSVYTIQVVSKDAAGNETVSIRYITTTPQAPTSALQLILGNLADIFSFLR